MQIKTPVEITDAAINAGNAKVARTLRQPVSLLASAMLAGAFISMGGILSLIVGFGFPELTGGNPSLQRLLSGVMFPIGLILVVVLGYEHCIANMFYLPLAMLEGAPLTIDTCLTNNILPATIGNIIGGALFVGCLHTYLHRPRAKR